MIEIRELTAGYPDAPDILSDLSFVFPDDGVIALTGASGIGKTTLMRVLAGLTKPSQGSIHGLDGRRLVLLFQEDRLLPWCKVLTNVLLGMPTHDVGRANAILQALDIGETASLMPSQLSGGMQRRVALARALGFGADVLLMDEPFTGMDEKTVAHIAPYVRASAPLILFTSHNLQEIRVMQAQQIDLVNGHTLTTRAS